MCLLPHCLASILPRFLPFLLPSNLSKLHVSAAIPALFSMQNGVFQEGKREFPPEILLLGLEVLFAEGAQA
jgi:hypothetical protein